MKKDVHGAGYYIGSFLVGAMALGLFSIPHKYLLDVDPFVFKGFIIPVLLGGSVGVTLAVIQGRLRTDMAQSLGIREALRESEERFRQLFSEAPIAMAYISMDGKILALNDLLQEMMGYDQGDVPTLEQAWKQSMPDPDLRERVASKWQADLARHINDQSAMEPFECPLVYKDGSRHTAVIGTKLIGENILVSFFDITDRKRDAEAADFERRQLLSVFNNLNEIIYVSDPETYEILFANQRLKNLTGKDPTGSLCYKSLQGFDQPCDFCTNQIILNNGGKPHLWEYRNPTTNIDVAIVDQIIRWPDGRDVRLEIAVDITEKKKVEEALRASERKLRSIFEAMTDVILIYDVRGRYVEIAPTNTDLLVLPPDELIGKNLADVFPPEKAAEFLHVIETALSQGKTVSLDYDLRIKERDLCFAATVTPVSRDQVILVARDITERKQAEIVLREREEKYRLLADNITDNIWVLDLAESHFSYVSPSVFTITGYTAEEAIGFKLSDLIAPSSLSLATTMLEKELLNDSISDLSKSLILELELFHKNGSTVWTEASMSLIRNQDGRPKAILGVSRDISERKKLQTQLQQAQKMETIGRLAGGIAHDFNNILQAIMGYSELARQKAALGKKVHHELEVVIQAGSRATELVNQILSFSRWNKPERKPLDLGQVVKEALTLLRASLPATIEIRQTIEDASDYVLADPIQIHQVIMNLCTNAAHAMRESGGVISVALNSLSVDTGLAAQNPDLNPGKYQRLSISDNGRGMDRETISLIFDPFFTTKKKGEGTGMGMSVVHGIIKNHHGAITVYSELGVGSTFHVYLPVLFPDGEIRLDEAGPSVLPTGTERILYVDDEELIVEVTSEMLESLGYTVTSRTSGLEALELFKQDPYRFDLIITDQTMPQMTGVRLAGEMMKIRPDIPIILCTGFSEIITSEKAKALGLRELVMKPSPVDKMAKVIRDVLDENKARNQSSPLAAEDMAMGGAALPRLRILLADDDPVSRKLAETFLVNAGHEVLDVENGQEALAVLDREDFDLVILDGEMPVMDGIHTAAVIRTKEKEIGSASVPMIAMTGYNTESDRKRYLDAGFNGYVSKPISSATLLGCVEDVLKKKIKKI